MKQVIVMRTDLGMRRGKQIAQGAHATWMFFLAPGGHHFDIHVSRWFTEGMKKICVRVENESEMLRLAWEARRAGLRSHIVTDAGHTEFDGVPTKTCLAIGPNEDEAVDAITKDLKLL